MFNNLPLNIMHLSHDTNKYELALKKSLLEESFYSCNEYSEWNLSGNLGTY
jgi:hypothetical protein